MLFVEDKERQPNLALNEIEAGVIESVLLGVKEAFHSTISESLKQQLGGRLGTYVDAQLSGTSIDYQNKEDLLLFLSERFEVVQTLINACKEVRKQFPEQGLSLALNEEMDKSGFCSVSLLVSCSDFVESDDEAIMTFGEKYFDSFGKHGVLFYVTADYPA